MRSRDTKVRGRIGLIKKGSKTIAGVADLIETLPKLSRSELTDSIAKHKVPMNKIGEGFKHNIPWVLEQAQPLQEPVAYRHPRGAVIWVNLDPEVEAKVQRQLTKV